MKFITETDDYEVYDGDTFECGWPGCGCPDPYECPGFDTDIALHTCLDCGDDLVYYKDGEGNLQSYCPVCDM